MAKISSSSPHAAVLQITRAHCSPFPPRWFPHARSAARGLEGSYSADGKYLAYRPTPFPWGNWSHYRGGTSPRIGSPISPILPSSLFRTKIGTTSTPCGSATRFISYPIAMAPTRFFLRHENQSPHAAHREQRPALQIRRRRPRRRRVRAVWLDSPLRPCEQARTPGKDHRLG